MGVALVAGAAGAVVSLSGLDPIYDKEEEDNVVTLLTICGGG